MCKAKKIVSKQNKAISDKLTDQVSTYKNQLKVSGAAGLQKISQARAEAAQAVKKGRAKVTGAYLNMPWRKKRPDVTLLAELALVLALAAILYYCWPYLTGTAKAGFSKEQFQRAAKLPETAFSVEELAKVKLEVKAFQDYAAYFKNNPYSLANNGIYDLMVSVAILPFIMFFVQFVLPPLVLAYIIWFIIRFWPYVFSAMWGWFLALYDYFTSLVQGKVGCKWYIKMVTGWSCRSVNFYDYVVRWRRRYIDIPIYYEKLSYVRRFQQARDEYYTKPLRKYVTLPIKRYGIKAQYAKKLYVDRSVDVFLKELAATYPQYYTMPKAEFYKWLLGQNKHLAGMYVKAVRTKEQIEGRSYKSLTKSGKACTCPGSKTPVKVLTQALDQQADEGKADVDTLVKATQQTYDKINKVAEATDPDCGKIDAVIENRRGISMGALGGICAGLLVCYMISSYFGTPVWLKRIITPTQQYVLRGASVVASGNSYFSLPILYLSLAVVSFVLIRFS